MSAYYLGLDVGQASDFTALAAVRREPGEGLSRYLLSHLERVRGLPYVGTASSPGLVEKVSGWVRSEPALAGSHAALDRTGVGRAVGDAFRAAGLPCCLWAVTVTAGQEVRQEHADIWVPKRDLVSCAQTLLSSGRLVLDARLPLAELLRAELKNFRVKVTESGNETFGVWRENEHDDLVFAVALACWLAERFPSFTAASIGQGGRGETARPPRGTTLGGDFRHWPKGV